MRYPGWYILENRIPRKVKDIREYCMWDVQNSRIVEQTQINERVMVSTVFLGLDHQYGEGPPLVFETMVFRQGDGNEMERYSTWDDAEEGHKRMVAEVMEDEDWQELLEVEEPKQLKA